MILFEELKKITVKYPFVYELYKDDSRDGLSEYFSYIKENEAIFISYHSNSQRSLIESIVSELYRHYKQEAPDISEGLKKVALGTTKIGLFLAGKYLTAGLVYALAPWVGSLITIHQWTNKDEEKEMKHKLALNALSKFKEEKKNIKQVETLLLAVVRLLFTLNYAKKIVLHIQNPEELNPVDLQFLTTYYGLFKDRFSRLSIAQEMVPFYKQNHNEATSPLLTILDWEKLESGEYLIEPYFKNQNGDFITQFKLWRWFLRRYKMVDDLHINHIPDVIDNDIFVGRETMISSLKNDFLIAKNHQGPVIRSISGNSGMGKSTLALQFIDEVLDDTFTNTFIVNTNFSGETIGISKGLTEIRNAINKLKIKLKPNFTQKINNILKAKQHTKDKAASLNKIFDVSADIESVLTPILSIKNASLGGIGDVISGISAIKDSVDTTRNVSDLDYIFGKLSLSKLGSNESIQETFKKLVTECVSLFQIAKEKNQPIVWVIDDYQWMDEESATFFNMLLESIVHMRLPAMLLFLHRQSDSKSRIHSAVSFVQFKELFHRLENVDLNLEGFKVQDITKYMMKTMRNEQHRELTVEVAKTLADWFQIAEGKELEPLFLKETFNLFYYPSQSEQSFISYDPVREKWEWAITSKKELVENVKANLNHWFRSSENVRRMDDKFTPMVQAVIEERISRLVKHFGKENGYKILQFLESGAFIGEPLRVQAAVKFIEGLQPSDFNQEILDDIEFTYKLLVRFFTKNSHSLFYQYTHNVYKEFLELRFRLNLNPTEINNQHVKILEIIDEDINELLGNEEQDEELLVPMLRAAVLHGSYGKEKNTVEKTLVHTMTLIGYEVDHFKYQSAFQLSENGLELAERFLGYTHIATLNMLHMKATLYHEFGNYPASIELLKKGLSYSAQPGLETLDLQIKNLLGLNYRHLGDFEKAKKYYLEADLIKNQDLINKLALVTNLAVVYKNLGEYPKAEQMYLKSLTLLKKDVNEDFKELRGLLNYNLGAFYKEVGEVEQSISAFKEAITIFTDLYTPEHPITAKAINALGSVYVNTKHPEAEVKLEESTRILESLLPASHPDIALAYINLASLHFNVKGVNRLAEEYTKKALKLYFQVNGINNVYFADALENLGAIYITQKKKRKAEKTIKWAMTIKEKLLDKNSPKVAQSKTSLAAVYLMQDQEEKAYPLLLESLEIRKGFGKLTDSLFATIDSIITVLNKLGNFNDLRSFIHQEIDPYITSKKKILPHNKYVEYFEKLVMLYKRDNNIKREIKYYPILIKNHEYYYGKETVKVALFYHDFAYAQARDGSSNSAELHLKKALEIFSKHAATNRDMLETCISNMIKLLSTQNNPKKLSIFMRQAKERWGYNANGRMISNHVSWR